MSKSKKEVSYLKIYKEKMEAIPCMEAFIEEIPDIFDISSSKSKEFLISCFTNLDSYFHYLSFLNKDDIDRELLKASQILNIHPHYPLKSNLFEGLDSTEQHKFWMRFFSHFEMKNKKSEDDFLKTCDINDKCKQITNIKDALCYFNFEFPIVHSANIKKVDLNPEIEKWKALVVPEEVLEEDLIDLSPMKEMEDIDISKTVEDVKYLTIKYDLPNTKLHETFNDYEGFFKNFNIATENIINYTENVKVIESFHQNNLLKKLSEHDSDFTLPNINQVKRCHELVRKIKSKREGLYK